MAKTKTSKPKKETCEIIFLKDGAFSNQGRFIAEALSPTKGKYFVMMSEKITLGPWVDPSPMLEEKTHVDTQNHLVTELLAKGWKPVQGRKKHWWSKKFSKSTK